MSASFAGEMRAINAQAYTLRTTKPGAMAGLEIGDPTRKRPRCARANLRLGDFAPCSGIFSRLPAAASSPIGFPTLSDAASEWDSGRAI